MVPGREAGGGVYFVLESPSLSALCCSIHGLRTARDHRQSWGGLSCGYIPGDYLSTPVRRGTRSGYKAIRRPLTA